MPRALHTSQPNSMFIEALEARVHLALAAALSHDAATVVGAGNSAGEIVVATRNTSDSPVLFERSGTGSWRFTDLSTVAAGEGITGAVTTWTDAPTGRTRVAGLTDSGMVVYEEQASGSWRLRRLTTELSGAEAIVSGLTSFVDTGGLATVAGFTASGDLVMYRQTGIANTFVGGQTLWVEPPLPWLVSPVPEYNDYSIQDVGITRIDGFGNYYIVYNPLVLAQAGPWADEYFRAHEYGHVVHRDVHRLGFNPPSYLSVQAETEADLYATDIWALRDPAILDAAQAHFFAQGPYPLAPTHPSGVQRAQNIAARRQFIANAIAQQSIPPTEIIRDWSFVNITDTDLTPHGDDTPLFASAPVSYVTVWNGQNIAGLTSAGDVVSIWWAPGQSRWSVANLSDVTGAPRLTGELAVYLTPWDGINIAGTDSAGNVRVTWWVPSFGEAWAQDNLTTQVDGPKLANGLTSYVTPWGGLNIAGVDDDGSVVVYWWAPGVAAWATAKLSDAQDPVVEPSGALSSFATPRGVLNIVGREDDGSVFRLWWEPGEGDVWTAEDLTGEVG